MEKKRLQSNTVHSWLLILSAAALILAAVLFTLLLPAPELLYRENRRAASRPYFSAETLWDASYGEDLSAFLEDRVVLRQFWINAKCFMDEMLLGMTEENGILIGKEARLFAKQFPGHGADSRLDKNIDGIAAFASESELPVAVLIAPSAGTIYPELLPSFAPQESETGKLSEIRSRLSAVCTVADPLPVLTEHKDEYLYYRNDHHWTTLGAYYAYSELARALGRNAASPDWENAARADGFLGTYYAKTRYSRAMADTIRYFPSDAMISIRKVTGDAEFEEERQSPVINTEKLSGYDPYAAFLDGNNGYSVITGTGSGRVLIVKDSFANCLIPFMLEDYARIGVVDYRNYSYGLRSLAEKEQYDMIIFIYSYAALETDSRLININRA